MDPEYVVTQELTEKSDIYSYGVLLLELLTGRRAIQDNRNLVEWSQNYMAAESRLPELVDPRIGESFDMEQLQMLVGVIRWCTQREGQSRPSIKQILRVLSECLEDPINDDFLQGMDEEGQGTGLGRTSSRFMAYRNEVIPHSGDPRCLMSSSSTSRSYCSRSVLLETGSPQSPPGTFSVWVCLFSLFIFLVFFIIGILAMMYWTFKDMSGSQIGVLRFPFFLLMHQPYFCLCNYLCWLSSDFTECSSLYWWYQQNRRLDNIIQVDQFHFLPLYSCDTEIMLTLDLLSPSVGFRFRFVGLDVPLCPSIEYGPRPESRTWPNPTGAAVGPTHGPVAAGAGSTGLDPSPVRLRLRFVFGSTSDPKFCPRVSESPLTLLHLNQIVTISCAKYKNWAIQWELMSICINHLPHGEPNTSHNTALDSCCPNFINCSIEIPSIDFGVHHSVWIMMENSSSDLHCQDARRN